jgi:hypothetical protein
VAAGEVVVVLSIPDVLGALVLKGAAYVEDSRDRDRHLDGMGGWGLAHM